MEKVEFIKNLEKLKFKINYEPRELYNLTNRKQAFETNLEVNEDIDSREEVKESVANIKSKNKRFHGAKVPIAWFPIHMRKRNYKNTFTYAVKDYKIRKQSILPPKSKKVIELLDRLGNIMGDVDRVGGKDSNIPAGYTYFGQFVDHDITMDIESSLEKPMNANNVKNMRTPFLDLDSLYGRGPMLDPYLYEFPEDSKSKAIKLALGKNKGNTPGGPGGEEGKSGMVVPKDFDVPRMENSKTAVIGDPRNDENLIVSQLHHTFIKFHNNVVDFLISQEEKDDIFTKARKAVTFHYQWLIVHDFLKRICIPEVVDDAIKRIKFSKKDVFKMPVEFSVAAYRLGHSMIRNSYWINFNFINASLKDVFAFARNPNLPVHSNWVVDFNAFVETGIQVPVFNFAQKINTNIANELEKLPGFEGMMAILARRNLLRGLMLKLPSGQGVAKFYNIKPLSREKLLSGLPEKEANLLKEHREILLKRTPLWYYILREADIHNDGNRLGPVGSRILADTFIGILKNNENSIFNTTTKFTPFLGKTEGDFTLSDLIMFSGVNVPDNK